MARRQLVSGGCDSCDSEWCMWFMCWWLEPFARSIPWWAIMVAGLHPSWPTLPTCQYDATRTAIVHRLLPRLSYQDCSCLADADIYLSNLFLNNIPSLPACPRVPGEEIRRTCNISNGPSSSIGLLCISWRIYCICVHRNTHTRILYI